MNLPKVATRNEWLKARTDLLAKEKEFTRQRDALSATRRKLPMVKVDNEYRFQGPDGALNLIDLFDGRRQLIVYHFMFDPSWTEGCKACSFIMDSISGNVSHLAARDTSAVAVSLAPYTTIEPFKNRMGWAVPWYSSFGTNFNYDFHVTLDPDRGDHVYNYASVESHIKAGEQITPKGEMPGLLDLRPRPGHVPHRVPHARRDAVGPPGTAGPKYGMAAPPRQLRSAGLDRPGPLLRSEVLTSSPTDRTCLWSRQ